MEGVVAQLSEEFPSHSIRYVRGSRRGVNAARNAAIEAALTDLLLFVDDDIDAPT